MSPEYATQSTSACYSNAWTQNSQATAGEGLLRGDVPLIEMTDQRESRLQMRDHSDQLRTGASRFMAAFYQI